jgi:D-arabinose 1-dehydrogenase-like Zn-dependent alcohol dehydrogenase
MAIKLALAMGAEVTVISTSPEKETDARRLGARHFLLSTDTAAMKASQLGFNFILSTIPEAHDINPYIQLLARDGTVAVVGTLVPYSKPTNKHAGGVSPAKCKRFADRWDCPDAGSARFLRAAQHCFGCGSHRDF